MELTIKEVSENLRVQSRKVYDLILEKKLPAYKVGSRWRVSSEDLEEFKRKAKNEIIRTN